MSERWDIPPIWVRLWYPAFKKWRWRQIKIWSAWGKQQVEFPVCACHFDEQECEVIRPCAAHKAWAEGLNKKLQEEAVD